MQVTRESLLKLLGNVHTDLTGFYGATLTDSESLELSDCPFVEIDDESLDDMLQQIRRDALNTIGNGSHGNASGTTKPAENPLIQRLVGEAFKKMLMRKQNLSGAVREPSSTPAAVASTSTSVTAFRFKHECKAPKYK